MGRVSGANTGPAAVTEAIAGTTLRSLITSASRAQAAASPWTS